MAGDVEQVLIAAAAAGSNRRSRIARARSCWPARSACGVAGDQCGGPRVHHDVRAGREQGQVGQPAGVGRQPGQVLRAGGRCGSGLAGPGVRVKARSSRVIGARQTATWARTAPWRGVSRPSRLIEQDVGAAQEHRLIDRAGHHAGARLVARSQVDVVRAGQVAEPGLDVAQAGVAAAQQRVGELDQPRVPADGPGQQLLVGGVQVGERGQAQEHPPQLRRRQRRDRHLGQEPVRARQRVPAGDQQRPGLGRIRQDVDHLADRRVSELLAARGQVLLEIIEHHQQPALARAARRPQPASARHHCPGQPAVPGPGDRPPLARGR